MKSTIEKEFRKVDGAFVLVPREFPDFYGIPDIGFIYINNWTDPQLEYKGHKINATLIEDCLWSDFREDFPTGDDDDFYTYCLENPDMVYAYCDDAIRSVA